MDGLDGTGPRAAPDWETIRAEYEGKLFHPEVICQRHGITTSQLRYRRERGGWSSITARPTRQADLVMRMMRLLERQLGQLERAMKEPVDKRVNTLAVQVRTLDKLIELGAAARNVEPASRKDMTDLRAKLVERLAQYKTR
ncbi:hypothetical protein ACFOOL_07360 [Devosia honganensis]|uniref:Transposase n=1 Tax=Devosia honganensis TaxID=1610527 RepID=A0ABV7WZ33_9HYPH